MGCKYIGAPKTVCFKDLDYGDYFIILDDLNRVGENNILLMHIYFKIGIMAANLVGVEQEMEDYTECVKIKIDVEWAYDNNI